MTEKTKKKRAFLVVILAVLCSGMFLLNQSREKPKASAEDIKRSGDQNWLVESFLHALMDNDIQFAKDLVVSEQQDRIDKWIFESNHESFQCPYLWRWIFYDPIQNISWGGTGGSEIENNVWEIDSTFGCNNSDRRMSIENAIVKSNGVEWVISDWEMICETLPSQKEACYR